MSSNPTVDFKLRITFDPPRIDLPVDIPHTPSPTLPTISFTGAGGKVAKALFEAYVSSSKRRAFALVMGSPHITNAQKKKLRQLLHDSYLKTRHPNSDMFDDFTEYLGKLNKLRVKLEGQPPAGEPPAQEPPAEGPPAQQPPASGGATDDDEYKGAGNEKGIRLDAEELEGVEPETIFYVTPPKMPPGSVPIYDDDELHTVVGYRVEVAKGVYHHFNLYGELVGASEKPLETPLIDLPDLFVIVGGGIKVIKGVTLGLKQALKLVPKIDLKLIGLKNIVKMREVVKRNTFADLKFTRTAIERMETPGRHVPAQLLDIAIKYGKATPDPQRAKGALLYTIPMTRRFFDEKLGHFITKEYTLEVLVRAKDRTILHFKYYGAP